MYRKIMELDPEKNERKAIVARFNDDIGKWELVPFEQKQKDEEEPTKRFVDELEELLFED